MSKPSLGLLLGAILGFVDGASAYLYPYPDVREAIIIIVVMSTLKGLITGVVAGWVATKWQSLPLGILVGLPLSFAAAGAIRAYLFGVEPGDGLTLATACTIVIAAALLAAYLPARRALRVDPIAALRIE